MKRTILVFVFLSTILLNIHGQRQAADWEIASGRWAVKGTTISQTDSASRTARVDILLPKKDIVEISFTAKYLAGGYESSEALMSNKVHGGFGFHIGVENPELGKDSWGNGKSYLLWLNIDTTDWTRENRQEYVGLRAQVYQSSESSVMRLFEDNRVARYAHLDPLTPGNYLSVDLIKSIQASSGMKASIRDIAAYAVKKGVPIRVRFNKRTGKISVQDPTNPSVRIVFYLDPDHLQGDYISLRTNSLALNFENFSIR